jgi:hypothetical protein
VSDNIGSELLPKVSAIISARDSEDLRWYFKTGGLNMFSGSPLGAMLHKMELFHTAARPCTKCGGDLQRWNGGTGFMPEETDSESPKGLATDKQAEIAALLDIQLAREGLAALGCKLCTSCGGRGWALPKRKTQLTKPLTARPTGGSKQGGQGNGVDVSDQNMARLGRVSRRMDMVRAAQGNYPAAAAIEAYYSPDAGDDVGCLWHLVPAGKTMLRGNSSKLHHTQFFQNLRAEDRQNPDNNRQLQFAAAQEQSTELFRVSCQMWNEGE